MLHYIIHVYMGMSGASLLIESTDSMMHVDSMLILLFVYTLKHFMSRTCTCMLHLNL